MEQAEVEKLKELSRAAHNSFYSLLDLEREFKKLSSIIEETSENFSKFENININIEIWLHYLQPVEFILAQITNDIRSSLMRESSKVSKG